MLASPPAPPATARFRDALVVIFALLTAVLAVVVWRQRVELRQLAAPPVAPLPGPAISVHTARATSLAVVPPRSAPAMPDSMHPPADMDESLLVPVPRAAAPRAGPADALARLLSNPEFFQLLTLHRQAALDARFGELFRRLALRPDELAAFKRLLAEKESVALDVVAVSEAQPEGPLPPDELNASITAARAQVEDAIRSSLGNERYAVYRDYEQSLPQRALVAQLEQRLSYSPTPLTPAQSEALVKILVAQVPSSGAAASAKGAPATVALLGGEAPPTRITNAAVAQSTMVLAPAQLAALRDLQAEQQATARAMELLRQSFPTAEPRRGLPLEALLQ